MSYKLEDVSGIGKAMAEKLKAAKIDSVKKLAKTNPADLVKLKIKGVGKATAEKYIANAKKFFKRTEVKEELSGVVKEKPTSESKAKPKQKSVSKEKGAKIKELIKKQAECNIGLVGHVDHGIY